MHDEEIREANGLHFLHFRNLSFDGLMHGFTFRTGGTSTPPYDTLNLGTHVGDHPQAVGENRRKLAAALGYAPENVVSGEQVHGTKIRHVSVPHKARGHLVPEDALPETDGLICTQPDIVLMAHAADCAILFFYDPQVKCIGLAHAGWRGTVAGMGPAMIRAMTELGCAPENIRVAVSPTIGHCCYQVGSNVINEIPDDYHQDVLLQKEDAMFLNIPGLHVIQLKNAGVQSKHIVQSQYCTCCHHELFFSYRASGGTTGRMAGVISLISSGQAIL